MVEKQLTKVQEAEIYCVKNGHADYIYKCWGYVHCGRCGQQIGDTLGGVFPCDKIIEVACDASPCKHCDPIYKKLSKMDKKILRRLKADHKKEKFSDHEKILKDINFDASLGVEE